MYLPPPLRGIWREILPFSSLQKADDLSWLQHKLMIEVVKQPRNSQRMKRPMFQCKKLLRCQCCAGAMLASLMLQKRAIGCDVEVSLRMRRARALTAKNRI